MMCAEVNFCLDYIKTKGMSLMKVNPGENPVFRYLVLNPEKNLTYFDRQLKLDKTFLNLKNFVSLDLGQGHEVYKEQQKEFLKPVKHLSFTLKFKDFHGPEYFHHFVSITEREFDITLCLIKGLVMHHLDKTCTKNFLLNHSRIYRI